MGEAERLGEQLLTEVLEDQTLLREGVEVWRLAQRTLGPCSYLRACLLDSLYLQGTAETEAYEDPVEGEVDLDDEIFKVT